MTVAVVVVVIVMPILKKMIDLLKAGEVGEFLPGHEKKDCCLQRVRITMAWVVHA